MSGQYNTIQRGQRTVRVHSLVVCCYLVLHEVQGQSRALVG